MLRLRWDSQAFRTQQSDDLFRGNRYKSIESDRNLFSVFGIDLGMRGGASPKFWPIDRQVSGLVLAAYVGCG